MNKFFFVLINVIFIYCLFLPQFDYKMQPLKDEAQSHFMNKSLWKEISKAFAIGGLVGSGIVLIHSLFPAIKKTRSVNTISNNKDNDLLNRYVFLRTEREYVEDIETLMNEASFVIQDEIVGLLQVLNEYLALSYEISIYTVEEEDKPVIFINMKKYRDILNQYVDSIYQHIKSLVVDYEILKDKVMQARVQNATYRKNLSQLGEYTRIGVGGIDINVIEIACENLKSLIEGEYKKNTMILKNIY